MSADLVERPAWPRAEAERAREMAARYQAGAPSRALWNERATLFDATADEIARLRKRVEDLEAGLRPFGQYLDTASYDLDNAGSPLPDEQGMGWVYLTVGDFRRARSLLSDKDQTNG